MLRGQEPRQTSGSNQYWSEESTSPPLRVTRPRNVTTLIESLMNRTLPSPNRALMPPGWWENNSSLAPALLPWVPKAPGVGPKATCSYIGLYLLLGEPDTPKD